jgi:hypothetical protein
VGPFQLSRECGSYVWSEASDQARPLSLSAVVRVKRTWLVRSPEVDLCYRSFQASKSGEALVLQCIISCLAWTRSVAVLSVLFNPRAPSTSYMHVMLFKVSIGYLVPQLDFCSTTVHLVSHGVILDAS